MSHSNSANLRLLLRGSCSVLRCSDSCLELSPHVVMSEGAEPFPREDASEASGDSEEGDDSPATVGPAQHPFVTHGVYMVGAQPLNSYEEPMREQYFQQHVYLIRGVDLHGCDVPTSDPAEALAFGMVGCGQASWNQLARLLDLLPVDTNLRWTQDENSQMQGAPKRFTIGAWRRGPMNGVNIHARRFPWTAKALSGIFRTWDSEFQFSTVTVSRNIMARPHRDSYNEARSRNLVLPASVFHGGQLFIESPEGAHRLQPGGTAGHNFVHQRAPLF